MHFDSKSLDRIQEKLINQIGFQIDFEDHDDQIIVKPSGIHQSYSFKIEINIKWKKLVFSLIFGNFAGGLLSQMEVNGQNNISFIKSGFIKIIESGGKINFKINSNDITETSELPTEKWNTLIFELTSKNVRSELSLLEHPEFYNYLTAWILNYFSLLLPLLIDNEDQQSVWNPNITEGSQSMSMSIKYERNALNRLACIQFHGEKCFICGFDFQKHYGEIGSGFIEVHHIEPVSNYGKNGQVIDPSQDLIPLCSNCHSMIHRKKTPYKPEELKAIYLKYNNN